MNKLTTIQDKNNVFLDSVLGRLVEKCESNEEDLFLCSLIDRGLAGTRAEAIVSAINDKDMKRLSYAILSCDTYNFPLLWKIEPRLFKLVLEDHVNVAMIERLESVLVDQKEAS